MFFNSCCCRYRLDMPIEPTATPTGMEFEHHDDLSKEQIRGLILEEIDLWASRKEQQQQAAAAGGGGGESMIFEAVMERS